MGNTSINSALPGGQFNTLAQIGTTIDVSGSKQSPIILHGTGTDRGDAKMLKNRAKKKLITQKLCLALIDVAKSLKDFKMVKSYWNTYHCQSKLISANNRLHGNYCKNRFCSICAGIRKAEIISKYLPVISSWEEAHFVTLTSLAVPASQLKGRFQRMIKSFNKILKRNKKRCQRGKGIKIMGIRSVESNFNPIKRTYNPHLHIIVSSREAAELIVKEWLKACTPKFAYRGAQDIQKVNDKIKNLIEVVKYGSKIFTDPTMQKKSKSNVLPQIYVLAYHNIIKAMSGLRIFERFGFNACPGSKAPLSELYTEYERMIFDQGLSDWVNEETAEMLTGYVPSQELQFILNGNMDINLQ